MYRRTLYSTLTKINKIFEKKNTNYTICIDKEYSYEPPSIDV